jgi:hypothetical protein
MFVAFHLGAHFVLRMVRTTAGPAPLNIVFAMAGSDPVESGSHLAEIACRADGRRRIDTRWLKLAAASRHRTLSTGMVFGASRTAVIRAINAITCSLIDIDRESVARESVDHRQRP